MGEIIYANFAHGSHAQAVASVRAHLHTILVISAELSNGIDLAESCIRSARLARAEFELLVEDANAGELIRGASPEGQHKTTLNAVANRAVELMEGGRKAQNLVNDFAATAVEAIATLKVNLQLPSAARDPVEAAELVELHKHAADIVAVCTRWVRLGGSMAHLLQHECAQLGHRLAEHAHCETLATEVLLRAQHSAGLGR